MNIRILGAAAGGGFPQWNCRCAVCRASWDDPRAVPPQTQSSLAVALDDSHWLLCNASPDLRQQIIDNPPLHPRRARRDSPIAGVVLTNGDVDHVAGLLNLRESQPYTVYATGRIQQVLADNPIFGVLNPDYVARREIALDTPFVPTLPDGREGNITVEMFAVPGKVALWLEEGDIEARLGAETEDTVGLEFTDRESGRRLLYVPGCAAVSESLRRRLADCDLLLFDGTLWQDHEMVDGKLGIKTGQRMGHMSMAGAHGSMAALSDIPIARRVYTHINNSNPVLLPDSEERRAVEAAGWTVAHDGMEIRL